MRGKRISLNKISPIPRFSLSERAVKEEGGTIVPPEDDFIAFTNEEIEAIANSVRGSK